MSLVAVTFDTNGGGFSDGLDHTRMVTVGGKYSYSYNMFPELVDANFRHSSTYVTFNTETNVISSKMTGSATNAAWACARSYERAGLVIAGKPYLYVLELLEVTGVIDQICVAENFPADPETDHDHGRSQFVSQFYGDRTEAPTTFYRKLVGVDLDDGAWSGEFNRFFCSDWMRAAKNETFTAKYRVSVYAGEDVDESNFSYQAPEQGIHVGLPVPSKIGYTFVGWKNSSGTIVTDSTVMRSESDCVLKAVWKHTRGNNAFDLSNLMQTNVCDAAQILKQSLIGHKWVRQTTADGTPVYEREGGFPDRTLRRSIWTTDKYGNSVEIVYSNAFDTKWYDSVGMYMSDTQVTEFPSATYLNAISINAIAWALPRMAKYLNYRNWRLRLLINSALSTMVDKFVITYPSFDTVVQGIPVYSYKLTKDQYFQSFKTTDTKFVSGKTYYKLDSVTGKLVRRTVTPSEIGTDIPTSETLYERYSERKTYYTRSVSGVRISYAEYEDEAGAPIRNEQSVVYRRSTDTTVDPTKHYFTTVDYVNFTEVHPIGTENPSYLQWYELANTDYATYYERTTKYKTEYHEVTNYFALTSDTTVVADKKYYIREDKRESGATDPVYQFTEVYPEVGSEIPANTYYNRYVHTTGDASTAQSGDRETPETHKFYIHLAANEFVAAGQTYVYLDKEGEEYKPCSLLVETDGEPFYTRSKNKTRVRTSDTYFKEPTKLPGGGYTPSKEYFIKEGDTFRAATIGTAAQVAAGTADYVQDDYEYTTDTKFLADKLYYVLHVESSESQYIVQAKAGTAEEVEHGVADYTIGETVPASTFYDAVGPTPVPSNGSVYEMGYDGSYSYIAIGEHAVGHIRDDDEWDHYVLLKIGDSYSIVGKVTGYDTVIAGKTKNDAAGTVLHRQLVIGSDDILPSLGYLYVDADDEDLTRVKNALNVFMSYYRTTLLMSNRSGTAYRSITGNTQYTTEDIILRLNSIVESINKYSTRQIQLLNEDEYTVRNLKLKVNELIEFIVDEEYYYNLCKSDTEFERNLTHFEEDFWNDFMGGQLIYNMTAADARTYCCYNDCLFYYEPSLPYLSYTYNKINWTRLCPDTAHPSVGDIKKELIDDIPYYYVYVGVYPEAGGKSYGWVPLHYVLNMYNIAENWSKSEYSAAMQVLHLTKSLLSSLTPDGNDWRTAMTNPRKRGSVASKFTSVLKQITDMEARIDYMLQVAPVAARTIADIAHWCSTYNVSSLANCFPYGK